MNKRQWDWIGTIGIIVMLVAGIYTYYESRVCHDPLKVILQQTLENTNNTDLNYSFATISFYAHEHDVLATESYKISYNGEYLPLYHIRYNYPDLEVNMSLKDMLAS